jgi:hypothetical protein
VYLGGLVGLIVILLSVLIIVGVLPLSNQMVGGMFGPIVDRYGKPTV